MISLLTEQDRAKAKAIVHCLFNDPQCSQSLQVDAGAAIQNLLSTLKETEALRQQDMARLARMREALEEAQALASGLLGTFGNEADIGIRYLLEIYERSLSETSDIQAWMDGQRAQWQPIESAPKNHNQILMCEIDPRTGNIWWACDGWWVNTKQNQGWSDGDDFCEPTHWMPLPDAPSARSTKGEG